LTILDENNDNIVKNPELEKIVFNYFKKILADL